jgi:hypothetical protein
MMVLKENAKRFTGRGGVEVKVRKWAELAACCRLKFVPVFRII